jgi:peptide/nickel transport system ATP-binding protein
MNAPLLQVANLTLAFRQRERKLYALHDVSFALAAGEVLGLVGESGAGKSLTGTTILGLLAENAAVERGEIRFDGRRLDPHDEASYHGVRGRRIGAIFQDPLASLNPVLRIGDQLTETLRLHHAIDAAEARDRAMALLADVGIPQPAARLHAYPHQFSGGMRQRVVIALALAGDPDLVIADEPTTALDVSTQAQVMALLQRLCRERRMAMILIAHDIDVVGGIADRIAVMYAGRIVEAGPRARILQQPKHPYTQGLLAAVPSVDRRVARLAQIGGAMPRLDALPGGCAFHPRCAQSLPRCAGETPMPTRQGDISEVACHLYERPT